MRDGLYLKLGAEAHSRARQARSTAAYTSRKKMVTILAMVLSFPENSTSWKRRDKGGEGINVSSDIYIIYTNYVQYIPGGYIFRTVTGCVFCKYTHFFMHAS